MSRQLVIFTVLFTVLGSIETWLLTRAQRRLDLVNRRGRDADGGPRREMTKANSRLDCHRG